MFGIGKQNEKLIPELKKKELTVAQRARKEAIEKLQDDLRENKASSEEVVKRRKAALIKLLENEIVEEFGELVDDKEHMHYSQPPEKSSNDSHIEDKKTA